MTEDQEYEAMRALSEELKYDQVFRYAVITLLPKGPEISWLMTKEEVLEELRSQRRSGDVCFAAAVTPIKTHTIRPPREPLEIRR